MPEKKNEPKSSWQPVTESYNRGDALTDGTYVAISKNGAVESPVESTILLRTVAEQRGLKEMTGFLLNLVADEKRGLVGCIPVPVTAATPSTVAVRWQTGKGRPRAGFHIGGTFKQYKSLALLADAKCPVAVDTADDGMPMLVIAIKSGLGVQNRTQETAAGEGV